MSLGYLCSITLFTMVNHPLFERYYTSVVSPLISLMEDQVNHLRSLGLSAVNITSQAENDHSKIENGKYSVVFGSPEAWLMNERWRNMLGNDVYKSKLCAIAIDEARVFRQW